MSRLAASSFVCLALLALLTGLAMANNPDPNQSFFDECLGRGPKNDLVSQPSAQYVFFGTLRTAAGAPVINFPSDRVELEIKAPCPNPVILNPFAASNQDGVVEWDVAALTQGGGACAGADVVEIRVDGQTFATLDDVRSPDINGNGTTDLGDLVLWQGAFTPPPPPGPIYIGDLDCSGEISLADLTRWQQHFAAELD